MSQLLGSMYVGSLQSARDRDAVPPGKQKPAMNLLRRVLRHPERYEDSLVAQAKAERANRLKHPHPIYGAPQRDRT